MFDFRAFWLRLGYVLGFREEPPKFNPRTDSPTAARPETSQETASIAALEVYGLANEDPKPVDQDWAGRRLLTHVILAGFVAVVIYGLFANASRVLIPVIWALGTLALGTLTGFLFCLPRIRQGEPLESDTDKTDPKDADAPTKPKRLPARNDNGYGLDINTNLEQISDWLSKIIVGLGLVELRKIPGHLVDLADYIAKDMGDPSARAFACGLVLFFAVCGFLYGYLYMRLILSHRFREADQKSKGLDQQKLDETAKIAVDTAKFAEDTAKNLVKLNAIHDAEMAGIQAERDDASIRQVEEAIRLLEDARKLQPDRRKTCMLLGVLYAIKKKEFGKAIRICEETIEAMRASNTLTPKDEADFRYNIACFNIAAANEPGVEEARKPEFVALAFRALDAAVRTSPALRGLVQSKQQKEWEPHRENPEFKRIVGDTTP